MTQHVSHYHSDQIRELRAEIDRLTGRLADLKIENWQLKGALGYEVPGQIPCGDFKCGLCEAKHNEIEQLRMQLADHGEALTHAERLVYESGLRLGEAHKRISELQGELRRVRGR